jgi:cytochrome c biogenesis protein CcmG/thiol:disulfide interchange protein DsbE
MSDKINDINVLAGETAEPQTHKRRFGAGSIVILVGIIAIAAVFGLMLARQNQGQPTSGAAPDFEFTTFEGETMRLSDLRGNVVVLNFWASWCTPCAAEAPELEATWQAYKDHNVVFLGVAYADNGPRSLEFMDRYGLTYMNAPDLGTRISEVYGIRGVPETFIIDPNGNVAQFIYANVNQKQLTKILDQVLAGGTIQ